MKKSITYLLLSIIFLSSCSQMSTLSVEKRHYRSGFYVDYNKKIKKEAASAVDVNEPAVEKISALIAKSDGDDIAIVPVINKNEITNAGLPTTEKKNKIKIFQNNFFSEQLIKIKKPLTTTRQVISAVKKINHHNDDGLSWFWSVIVLIVIIWLIAYLTGGWGLGGLINLLLVVALIFLILWLLKLV